MMMATGDLLASLSPAWTTAIAALAGAILTYLAAVRRLSGKVGTSEASELWEESREIRRDYQRRIEELNKVVERCQERIDGMETTNETLRSANGKLGRLVDEHERTIRELRAQVDGLTSSNEALKRENVRMRTRIRELEEVDGK